MCLVAKGKAFNALAFPEDIFAKRPSYETCPGQSSGSDGCCMFTGRIIQLIRRQHSSDGSKDTPASTSNLPHPRLDYKSISENVLFKSHNAFNRKASIPVGAVQSVARLYAEFKSVSDELNQKLALRNTTSGLIRSSGNDQTVKATALDQAKTLKVEISVLKARLVHVEAELLRNTLPIPNDSHPESPIGPEAAAATLSTHGPEPLPAMPSRDHVRVARTFDMLDLEAGSVVTGSSWYFLLNEGALLELALTNYAVSIAVKHGYRPVMTPDVIKADIATRCGFQPRDPTGNVQQMYHLTSESGKDHPELVLSGTAEIPLAGFFANKIFQAGQLPLKVVGIGKSFRAEAGARGADTRGLYRVHQFSKVELFAVCGAEQSDTLMEDMLKVQVDILSGLGLPFRVLDMPTEELGASAYRKYDIEAWMPGRGRWGEVTSTSNCTDYQSRRLHIRCRSHMSPSRISSNLAPTSSPPGVEAQAELPPNSHPRPTLSSEKERVRFAHTLNGTAAAIPRLIVALLENGVRLQGEDPIGLDLPSVLRPFWADRTGGEKGMREGKIRWI